MSHQRQPTRNRRNQRQQNMASSNPDGELGACIDLTGNDSVDLGEAIDLTETSTNQSMNDPDPVVVISPKDVDNADTCWRKQRRDKLVRQLARAEDRKRQMLKREAMISLGIIVPKTRTNNSTSPANVTCPICLEIDSQICQNRHLRSTWCGHVFCSTCIKQALSTRPACPTCHKPQTMLHTHPVYL